MGLKAVWEEKTQSDPHRIARWLWRFGYVNGVNARFSKFHLVAEANTNGANRGKEKAGGAHKC